MKAATKNNVAMFWEGEAIVAFVTLKEGCRSSEELRSELIKWVKVIGPIATPNELYFVSKLPKTRSREMMRRPLKAVVSGAPISDVSTLEDKMSVEETKRTIEVFSKAMKGSKT